MSEFLTIQVGQCGNQIGHTFWPLVLEEHGIFDSNGSLRKVKDDAFHSFFYNPKDAECRSYDDLKKNKIKARALLIDMENSVVDRFHSSKLRDLFDKACTLTNYPGSGNNWAVGHYTHGREQEPIIKNMLRIAIEKCDRLHGFISLFSLGGGTGSGLGTAVVKMLYDEYPKIDRLVSCVHPGEHNDVITSPYNTAFSLKQLKDFATCVLPLDNKALLSICNRLKSSKDMANWEPYRNMNSIIVKMLLHLTSGARFPGNLNFDISDMSTNLVPFPGLHFLASSMSPISFVKEKDVGQLKRESELLMSACSKDNQLLSYSSTKGTIYNAALFARGEVSLTTLRDYVRKFEKLVKFASWAQPGLKTSLCTVPAHDHPRSLLCLTNTSNMEFFFQKAISDFDKLYKRKAHIHHYNRVDGFEGDEFPCTRESLEEIVDRYQLSNKELNLPRLLVEI